MVDTCSTSTLVGVILGTFLTTSLTAGALLLAVMLYRRRRHLDDASQLQQPQIKLAFKCGCVGVSQGTPVETSDLPAINVDNNVGNNMEHRSAGVAALHRSSNACNTQVPIPGADVTDVAARRRHQLGLVSLPIEYGTYRRLHKSLRTNQTFSVNDRNIKSHQETDAYDVTLHGRPFEGLGFDIIGNMTDGIFVSRVLNRGPAYESGCIRPGDKLEQITVSTTAMVFEDALTILSYASSYPVRLRLHRQGLTASNEHHLSTDTLHSTASDYAAIALTSSTIGLWAPIIDGHHTLPEAAPTLTTESFPVVKRSLFRSQSCTLTDYPASTSMVYGHTNHSVLGMRSTRSMLALDEVPDVVFQQFGRHHNIQEDGSSEADIPTLRIRGRRGPRMGRRVSRLRLLHKVSFSSESAGSEVGLDRQDDYDSSRLTFDSSRSTCDYRLSTIISGEAGPSMTSTIGNERSEASSHYDVIKSKSSGSIDGKTVPNLSFRSCDAGTGVVNASWIASKTWKYIRHPAMNDDALEGCTTSANGDPAANSSRHAKNHRWGVIVGDVSATVSNVVVVTSGANSKCIEDSEAISTTVVRGDAMF